MISMLKIYVKINSVLTAFLYFLKYPTTEKIPDIDIFDKVKIVLTLIVIELPIMIMVLTVAAILDYFKFLPLPSSSLPDLIDPLGLILILILGTIVLPGIEEIIFRSYLVLPKSLNNYIWTRKFGHVFYASSMVFACAHLINFSDKTQAILFAPILLAPQFILGIFAGYLRVKFGIIWGFFFHSIHNLIFLSLFIIFN